MLWLVQWSQLLGRRLEPMGWAGRAFSSDFSLFVRNWAEEVVPISVNTIELRIGQKPGIMQHLPGQSFLIALLPYRLSLNVTKWSSETSNGWLNLNQRVPPSTLMH
jgi:hypothetical protein